MTTIIALTICLLIFLATRASPRRSLIALALCLTLSGCATQRSVDRLKEIEASLEATTAELSETLSAPGGSEGPMVAALETEIARLHGAKTEARSQVLRERTTALESGIQQAGGIASAIAPILGYFLPGAAGMLGALGSFLARRKI